MFYFFSKFWQKCGVSTCCEEQVQCSVTLIWGRSHLQLSMLWRHAQTSQVTPVFSIVITSLQTVCPTPLRFMHQISFSGFPLRLEGHSDVFEGEDRVDGQHPRARPAHDDADFFPHFRLIAVDPAG